MELFLMIAIAYVVIGALVSNAQRLINKAYGINKSRSDNAFFMFYVFIFWPVASIVYAYALEQEIIDKKTMEDEYERRLRQTNN